MSDPFPVFDARPPAPKRRVLDPVRLLKALADPTRYKALKEFATGEHFSVVSMAFIFRLHQDTMGKHLKVLYEAGAIARLNVPGADRRLQIYEVPAEYRQTTDKGGLALDYGVCVIRFG